MPKGRKASRVFRRSQSSSAGIAPSAAGVMPAPSRAGPLPRGRRRYIASLPRNKNEEEFHQAAGTLPRERAVTTT